jgi:hypothetical protein
MDGRPGDSQNVTSMTIMALAPPPPEPPLPAATIPQYAGPGRTSNRMNRVLDLLQAEPGRQWRAREIAGLLISSRIRGVREILSSCAQEGESARGVRQSETNVRIAPCVPAGPEPDLRPAGYVWTRLRRRPGAG